MTLTLRDYQREGTQFLLDVRKGALWYSPGLGKSFTASEAFKRYLPAVIAAPSYLLWQWKSFLEEQYPGIRVAIIEGTKRDKILTLGLAQADVYITTIASFRNYPMPQRAQSVVFDEAHHLKNRNALQSKAAAKYAKDRTLVIELTATPMRREVDDYFYQLHILDPKTFSSYHAFVERWCKVSYYQGYRPILRGAKDPSGLAKLLAHYGIAKMYDDVGIEVPPLIETVLYPELSPQALKEYRAIKQNYRDGPRIFSNAFQVVDHLRHLTFTQAKIDAIKEQLLDNDTKGFLCYCWYKEHAERLAKELDAVCITGDMPARLRIPLAKQSTKIVATFGALSEGGDISHVRTILFAEQYYTEDSQEVGRVVRPTGNNEPVLRYDVILRGTIDEAILKCRTRRIFDAEQILETEFAGDD